MDALILIVLGVIAIAAIAWIRPDSQSSGPGIEFDSCTCEDAPLNPCAVHPGQLREIKAYIAVAQDEISFYLPSGFAGQVLIVKEDAHTGAEVEYVNRTDVQLPCDL